MCAFVLCYIQSVILYYNTVSEGGIIMSHSTTFKYWITFISVDISKFQWKLNKTQLTRDVWLGSLLWLLLLLTAVTSCGPLSHGQSWRRQRRPDQRSHRLADLLPAVGVDHPAAWPAGPGLPAALPPLHTGSAQTGGQLRLSSCTKSSTPKPFIGQLNVPVSLQKAFRTGTSTRLDDRVFSMSQLKYQPLVYSMLMIHPALYRVDDLTDEVRRCQSVGFM